MEKSNEVSNPETDTPEASQAQTDIQRPVDGIPEQPLTEPTLPQKTRKKWLIPGLIGLVVVILGITGYFAYQNFQLKKEEPSLAQTTPTPTPGKPSPTIDPTTGWQSYNNEEYKFSFKYPTDYYLSDKSLKILPEDTNSFLGIIIIKEKNKELGQPPTISLIIVQTEKSSKEFLDYDFQKELDSWEVFEEEEGFEVGKPYIISEENVQTNQMTALKVERQRIPTAPYSQETWYLVKRDNLLCIFTVNYTTYSPDTVESGNDEKNTLDLIFSTFRFL